MSIFSESPDKEITMSKSDINILATSFNDCELYRICCILFHTKEL